jgi:predicted nucleotidyltransferase
MMRTIVSRSNTMSLDEVIERLRRHDVVFGVVVTGSAAAQEMRGASDYDLLVLRTDLETRGYVGLTYINGRVTDVIFCSVDEIARIMALEGPVYAEDWTGHVIRWLQLGRVAYDPTGEVSRARERVRQGVWLAPMNDTQAYEVWFSINFGIRHTRRMVHSDDSLYLMALDVRLLYGAVDIFRGYFHCRRLFWEGEKAALGYLQAHDPEFLAMFQRFVHTTDRDEKMVLYEELAQWATAPMGGIWPRDATAMQLAKPVDPVTPEVVQEALDSWEDLLREE